MEIREYTEYYEEEILSLYTSVGWTAYTNQPDSLRKGFENSLLILAAYEGDALQGIIRVVGDGYTIVFIQDILVYPEYHRQGIGSRLLQAVLERYRDVRQIHLATDNTVKNAAFYKSQMSEVGCLVFTRV
nr:GNAT family N-acetyltransferase [uncultured Acetatifactor sp.]